MYLLILLWMMNITINALFSISMTRALKLNLPPLRGQGGKTQQSEWTRFCLPNCPFAGARQFHVSEKNIYNRKEISAKMYWYKSWWCKKRHLTHINKPGRKYSLKNLPCYHVLVIQFLIFRHLYELVLAFHKFKGYRGYCPGSADKIKCWNSLSRNDQRFQNQQ